MSTTEAKRPLQDAEQRHQIATVLDRNVMVLAGAGAGKTHELVGRMIALLESGRVEVEQIAAITFTRKAAGELRSRFMERLREELPKTTAEKRTRLEAALGRADRAFMGTIHSFCGRLLRERPVEGRVPPDFVELEKQDERRLAREQWDQFIRSCAAADDPRLAYLEEAGIVSEDLFGFYCARNEVPELALKLQDVPRPDLIAPAREALAFMEEVKGRIPYLLPKGKDKLMQVVQAVSHAARNRGLSETADAAAILELVPEDPKIKNTYWGPSKDYATSLRDGGYEEFYARVVEPALRRWREHLYPFAAGLVDDAVKAYAEHREKWGRLTFSDLLLTAARMLKDSPEARAYFRDRYRTILVDEFQDTDPIQAEILLYLTASDLHEQNWRAIVPLPGRLFLVGDEKQSIYRFRRADVATFRFMRDRIAETGGIVLHLNTSFRSLGNLCGWINEAYPRAFREGFPDYQTEYGELFRYRPAGADPHCVRTIRLPYVFRNNNTQIVAAEADRIAAFIRAALDGTTAYNGTGEEALLEAKARPSDFLILTRYSTSLGAYAAALERAGVPYDVTGGKDLKKSEEVRALVELLRVVHEPDNAVHYLAFLRGLCVGLDDATLYRYRRAGGRFDPTQSLPPGLSAEDAARFAAARELVDWAGTLFRKLTPAAALEAVVDRTGLAAYARSQPLGSSRSGNVLRLVSFVRALEDRGLHWGQIVTELESVLEGGVYDLEEMTLSYGSDEAVRIMNIHQAKGLQAKVVFLADPWGKGHQGGVERHVSRVGDDPYLSIRISKRYGERGSRPLAQPVGWEADAEEEAKHEAAEEVRLLYVAGTRARNLLVVSLYEPKVKEGRHRWVYPALQELPELETHASDYAQGATEAAALPAIALAGGDGAAAAGVSLPRPGVETLEAPTPPAGTVLGEPHLPMLPNRAAQIASARRAQYRRTTVTGEKEEVAPLEQSGTSGKGRDFGTIVHTVLEDAVLGRLPEAEQRYVESLCAPTELDAQAATQIVQVLERFRNSALWAELDRADVVFTEVPVGVLDEGPTPLLVRGKIDLLYRVEGGWKIVDYKTDVDASAGQLPLDLAHYADQIRRYAAYWTRVTKEPVVDCAIYGTSGAGGLVPIT